MSKLRAGRVLDCYGRSYVNKVVIGFKLPRARALVRGDAAEARRGINKRKPSRQGSSESMKNAFRPATHARPSTSTTTAECPCFWASATMRPLKQRPRTPPCQFRADLSQPLQRRQSQSRANGHSDGTAVNADMFAVRHSGAATDSRQ